MSLSWIGKVRGPLVVTPVPDRRETAIGYVMRLTQANGYHAPAAFLPKASETQASARGGSVRTLRDLTGMSLEWAERLVIDRVPGGFRLLGHLLAFRDVRVDIHRICPACVEQDGLFDASWHLTCVTHCATHGLALIERCDACGKGLRLNRPGVGICRCDRAITGISTTTCSPELKALMQALRARLYTDERIAPSPKSLPHFDHLDLPSLVAVVRAMHKHLAAQQERSPSEHRLSLDLMDLTARAMHTFKDGLLSVQAALHRGAALLPGAGPGSQNAFNWYRRPPSFE